ncbi:MAG: hypothetical protein J5502_05375 [Prevotella sp.]|nr:hypothetical protein [Prevotella sp.]
MRRTDIFAYYDVYEATLKCMKKRKQIVRYYDLVTSYEDAVERISSFLNRHLRFTAPLQEELPELIVLAWHYAHKQYGCPLKETEFEAFMEALRVDVFNDLMKYVSCCVGVEIWYAQRHSKNKTKFH